MTEMDVKDTIGQAEDYEESTKAIVSRLADLSPLEYGLARKKEAERLDVPVTFLDQEVKSARGRNGHDDNHRGLNLPEPEPWSERVDGDDLLDQLCRAFQQYLALAAGADVILALWSVHAHCFDTGAVSPRLVLKSPEKRCGKTTTLTILSHLVPRPLPVANITPSAIFRAVEAARPTILIDEADTFLHGDLHRLKN